MLAFRLAFKCEIVYAMLSYKVIQMFCFNPISSAAFA